MTPAELEQYRPTMNCGWQLTALLWYHHGYWNAPYAPPDWYTPAYVEAARRFAHMTNPPDVRMEAEHDTSRIDGYVLKYRYYDAANPWIKPWENAVVAKSKAQAEQYVADDFKRAKYLHEGTIEALIDYAKTGIPKLTRWHPDNARIGYVMRDGRRHKAATYPRLGDN